MIKTFRSYLLDTVKIFNKKDGFLSKSKIFCTFLKITFMRFIDGRFTTVKSVKFLGFHTDFNDLNDFFWTFRELFINDDYYFETGNKEPVVFDGGGNIGMSVFYVKYKYPDAKITVFEPHPENIKYIKRNIEKNNLKDVTLIEKAIGGSKGYVEIFGNKRAATISKKFQDQQIETSTRTSEEIHRVEVDLISEYIDEDVDFLKLDIEGAEGDVIKDLSQNGLLKKIKQITMEYHKFDIDKNKLSEIIKVLEDNSFDIIFFSDRFDQYRLPKNAYYNFMLIAKIKEPSDGF